MGRKTGKFTFVAFLFMLIVTATVSTFFTGCQAKGTVDANDLDPALLEILEEYYTSRQAAFHNGFITEFEFTIDQRNVALTGNIMYKSVDEQNLTLYKELYPKLDSLVVLLRDKKLD